MEIEYKNQVTGFDFKTRTANFSIEGTCRKDTSTGAIKEFNGRVVHDIEPYQPHEVRLVNGEMKYYLQGLSANEIAEVTGAIVGLVEEFTA
jgi:hypothetical protein